jgi:DNA-binding winged helix-turn-helix (wHTH) protein
MTKSARGSDPAKYRFGPFELDPGAGELRKHGLRIRIQKQPFQILAALVRRPKEIVTRDELRKTIWGDDTVVDFEHGLNAAMNKLRQALSDSPDTPRFIETIPGTGYRLLVPVELIAATAVPDSTPPAVPASGVAVVRQSRGRWFSAIGVLATGVLCGWFLRPVRHLPASQCIKFAVPLPDGFWTELAGTRQDFAISPDGSRLAFVASDASKSQLWVRDLSSLNPRPLTPDGNVRGLVWAPDSRSLYFDERSTIRQIMIDTGVARTLGELPLRAPWMGLLRSRDELTLYTRAGTFALPTSGGTPKRIDDAAYRWTEALPSGFLLNVRYEPATGRYRAWASNLAIRADERPLIETDSKVAFAPVAPGRSEGHLLYVRAGALVAQPFDADTLQCLGDPVAVADNVFSFHPTGAAAFSASQNGVLAYRTAQSTTRLKWLDRSGRELATIGDPTTFMTPFRLSPDGRRIAATV